MVGANREAARVAGVPIERQFTLAMTLAGMLVGLAGAFMVLGVDYPTFPLYSGTMGFDGITVAILGRGTPLGVALSALLFGAFTAGGRTMQVNTSIPLYLVQVLQAVLVLFVAAPGVIRTIYRIRLTRRADGYSGGGRDEQRTAPAARGQRSGDRRAGCGTSPRCGDGIRHRTVRHGGPHPPPVRLGDAAGRADDVPVLRSAGRRCLRSPSARCRCSWASGLRARSWACCRSCGGPTSGCISCSASGWR